MSGAGSAGGAGAGAGRARWLWRAAAVFVAAQAIWFAGLAFWPRLDGVAGALVRIGASDAARVLLWQMWIGAPVLLVLGLRVRGGLGRGLIGIVLAASAGVAALCAVELALIGGLYQGGQAPDPQDHRALGALLDLLRLFECGLALATVVALRLAMRAEPGGHAAPLGPHDRAA